MHNKARAQGVVQTKERRSHCKGSSRCLSNGRDDEKLIWCRDLFKRLSESILTIKLIADKRPKMRDLLVKKTTGKTGKFPAFSPECGKVDRVADNRLNRGTLVRDYHVEKCSQTKYISAINYLFL